MSQRFRPGDHVRVQSWDPPGHVRTPFYSRGHVGRVIGVAAIHPNPEGLAYGRDGLPMEPVYRVQFAGSELWGCTDPGDTVVADLQESWLEPAR
jgi:nitrile hydratase